MIRRPLRDALARCCERGPGCERGSAVVEFVFLAVLVLVPTFYLVVMLARLEAGAYAASTAAREAGRAYVTAPDPTSAPARARAAAALAFADQGFSGSGRLTLGCDGSPCLRPGARVEARTEVTVPLPLVPGFAREVVPLRVPMRASHVSTVDSYRQLQR